MLIDLHSHLLPGLDDGPADIDGSVELAEVFVAEGIGRVVTTPHINARWGHPGRDVLKATFDALVIRLAERELDLRLDFGGEIALTTAGDLTDDQLLELRLGGGDWLLVEPPSAGPSLSIHSMLYEIQSRGHRILLAHPERCATFQEDLDLLSSLVDGGLRTQVTATALTGRFGNTAQRTAEEMFRRGLVHTVASDAHHANHRPPGMTNELKRAGHEDMTRWLCHDMPAWILDGGDEPARPDGGTPGFRRSRWRFRRS